MGMLTLLFVLCCSAKAPPIFQSGGNGASAAHPHLLLSLPEPGPARTGRAVISGWHLGDWTWLCELSLVWQLAVPGP